MSSVPTLNEPGTIEYGEEDRGVDSTKVESACQAFNDYKTDIENTFSGFKEQITGYSEAFYGDTSNKVKAYVDKVIDSCSELLQTVADFQSKVTEAEANYASQATSIYDTVGVNGTGSN